MAALAIVLADPALAQPPENSIRGVITEVSRSAEVVLVEQDPSEQWGSAKGEFAVTEETEILAQQGGAPASFNDLRAGQLVEATYVGPVAESFPTQGVAGRIVILNENGGPSVLPDTGGAPLMGGLLLVGVLLTLWVARFPR